MSDYKIGYGNPPTGSRFRAGNNANPKGRPRLKPLALAKTMQSFRGSSAAIPNPVGRKRPGGRTS
jgi:hypothetical protein